MPDLGILCTAYYDCPVTKQNLDSIRQHNPGVPVVEIICPKLPDGPERNALWSRADKVYFDWYTNQHTIDCARWLWLEWDVYATMSLKDWLKPVWDADVSAPFVHVVENDIGQWYWFRYNSKLPEDMKPHACGLVTLAGIMMSDRAMAASSKIFQERPVDVFSELRTGTIARFAGFEPKANPVPHFDWYQVDVNSIQGSGVWHQVKQLVPGGHHEKPSL